MAGKKPSKQVLDYDPLAWLDEASGAEQTPDSPPSSNADSSQAVADERAVEESQRVPGVTEPSAAPGHEPGDLNDESKVEQGFGFFDQPAAASDQQEHEMPASTDDDDEAYGFFDHEGPGPLQSQGVRLDAGGRIIETGAELTIRSAATFKEMVDRQLAQDLDIQLSARELQKIDTAGLQLLYSLGRSLDKTGQSIHWVHSSSVINDAAALLGLPPLADETAAEEQAYGLFESDAGGGGADPVAQEEDGYGFF